MDMIYNGQASGSLANLLLQTNFNTAANRPFLAEDNRSYITVVNAKGELEAVPQVNATATLRKDDWSTIDRAVIRAGQPRLRFVGDLRARGLEYVIPGGMGKTVLETESMSDVSPATLSMDGMQRGQNDRPQFDLTNLPLVIAHKDFSFSLRQIMASRNGGSPLDTTTAELASRQVAEEVEKLALGKVAGFKFAGASVYGLTNFPKSIAATITSPTESGWTPQVLVDEVLVMVQASMSAYHYGPWALYYGPAWGPRMSNEYKAESSLTLAQRLRAVDDMTDVKMLDHLTGYELVLVQMTSDVVRMVIGMDMTTLQWESHGGMEQHFKVMTIMVPQLRADYNSRSGIVHAQVQA